MSVEFDKATVRFGKFEAVSELDLALETGTRLAVVGESGAGKSTLLNMAAGLVVPCKGSARVFDQIPGSRDTLAKTGFVFQSDALFPHLSVRENIRFPLQARRWSKNAANKRVDELLELFEISEQAGKPPEELSGGQRQRVSIARALAPSPDLLLLDEPFASLDGPLRRRVRELVIGETENTRQTTILVTHDPEEAMAFGERVIVLKNGRIVADGQSKSLYWCPKDKYVAELLGECNVIRGGISGESLSILGVTCQLSDLASTQRSCEKSNVLVFIRPEAMSVHPVSSKQGVQKVGIQCKVSVVRDTGRFLSITVQPRGDYPSLRVDQLGGDHIQQGSDVILMPDWSRVHILTEGHGS